MRNTKIKVLCECAIMVALAFALSCIKIIQMPLGGSVTLVSMLPIMLISLKHGYKIGLGTGFVYSMTQLTQALIEGDVFPYCQTFGVLIVCLLFDYLIPFTGLGIAGLFKDMSRIKNTEISCYLGFGLAVGIRFICHFITGVAVWGQWAPEGMGKFLYSFLYNAGFLSVDFLICIVCAILIFRKAELRKLLNVE